MDQARIRDQLPYGILAQRAAPIGSRTAMGDRRWLPAKQTADTLESISIHRISFEQHHGTDKMGAATTSTAGLLTRVLGGTMPSSVTSSKLSNQAIRFVAISAPKLIS